MRCKIVSRNISTRIAHFFTLIGCSHSITGIFDHLNFVGFCNLVKSSQVCRLPCHMVNNDRSKFFTLILAQYLVKFFQVDIITLRFAINKDRLRIEMTHYFRQVGEAVDAANDFVPPLEIERTHCQMKCRCPTADSQSILCPNILLKILLQRIHFGFAFQTEYLFNVLLLFLADRRNIKWYFS